MRWSFPKGSARVPGRPLPRCSHDPKREEMKSWTVKNFTSCPKLPSILSMMARTKTRTLKSLQTRAKLIEQLALCAVYAESFSYILKVNKVCYSELLWVVTAAYLFGCSVFLIKMFLIFDGWISGECAVRVEFLLWDLERSVCPTRGKISFSFSFSSCLQNIVNSFLFFIKWGKL